MLEDIWKFEFLLNSHVYCMEKAEQVGVLYSSQFVMSDKELQK